MEVEYPKHPSKILIRVTSREMFDGMVVGGANTEKTTLGERLDHYIMRLGPSNPLISAIGIHLTTDGKVCVDWREHTERIELMDMNDQLPPAQAASMMADFIAEHPVAASSHQGHITQKIIVESPWQISGSDA